MSPRAHYRQCHPPASQTMDREPADVTPQRLVPDDATSTLLQPVTWKSDALSDAARQQREKKVMVTKYITRDRCAMSAVRSVKELATHERKRGSRRPPRLPHQRRCGMNERRCRALSTGERAAWNEGGKRRRRKLQKQSSPSEWSVERPHSGVRGVRVLVVDYLSSHACPHTLSPTSTHTFSLNSNQQLNSWQDARPSSDRTTRLSFWAGSTL